MNKTQPFTLCGLGRRGHHPDPAGQRGPRGTGRGDHCQVQRGGGRGAVSLRGTGLGVKGLVGPMSILQAVNMRGLRLAGSKDGLRGSGQSGRQQGLA